MNLHKRKRSPYWYARGSVDGNKFFLKTDLKWRKWDEQPGPEAFAAWSKVRDEFAHKVAEVSGDSAKASVLTPSLENMELLFFKHHEDSGVRPATLQGYRWNWDNLKKYLGCLEDATGPRGLLDYVAKRSRMVSATTGRRISARTVEAEVKLFFAAWRWSESYGMVMPTKPQLPSKFGDNDGINKARAGKYRSAKRIWAFINMLNSQEAKDRALFIALTGLRFEELARIENCKIIRTKRFEGVAAFLELEAGSTKGRKDRLIGLTPTALAIYKRNHPFTSKANRTAWRTASRKLGLSTPLHARDLRASFASGVIAEGASQTHKDMVMGHWKGISSRYQKAIRIAAARVARAASKWLVKGKRRFERGAQGVHSAKIVQIRENVN